MLSNYKICGDLPSKTIVYDNLYFYGGKYYFLSDRLHFESDNLKVYLSIHFRHTGYDTWEPEIISKLPDEIQLNHINMTHFLVRPSVLGHVGHTIFDDVFGQFNVLSSIDETQLPIRTIIVPYIINNDFNTTKFDCKKIYKLAFGKSALLNVEKYYGKEQWLCFKKLIVGTGDVGLSSYDETYVSPNINYAWKRFRDHLYHNSGINSLTITKTPKILFVRNRRIITDTDKIISKLRETYDVTEVSWNTQGPMQDIKEQVKLIAKHNVYISTDGSAALNAIFLPDNATFINVGLSWNGTIGWCEDYLYPALQHIKVLYYENFANALISETEEIILDVNVIINMISLSINLLSTDNRSPNAHFLFQECPHFDQRKQLIKSWRNDNSAYACTEYVYNRKRTTISNSDNNY